MLKKVKSVTGPLQPVIDTLYAPIPVLSDLSKLAGGGDVSLITLAKTFNTLAGGPKLEFVDTIAALTTLINNLPTCDAPGDACLIPIGELHGQRGEGPRHRRLADEQSRTRHGGLAHQDGDGQERDRGQGRPQQQGRQGQRVRRRRHHGR